MNPTVLNVIIALLSVVLGYQFKIIQLQRHQGNAEDELFANLGFAYEEGFDDGYNAAETEDDVDEFIFNVEELTGVDPTQPGSYVTPSQLGITSNPTNGLDNAKLILDN